MPYVSDRARERTRSGKTSALYRVGQAPTAARARRPLSFSRRRATAFSCRSGGPTARTKGHRCAAEAVALRFVASVRRCSAGAPTHDEAVDQEEKDRSDDRRDPRAPVEELVDRVAEAECLGDEPADDGTHDPDESRDDDPSWIVSRKDRFRDRAGEQSKNDPADDSHK